MTSNTWEFIKEHRIGAKLPEEIFKHILADISANLVGMHIAYTKSINTIWRCQFIKWPIKNARVYFESAIVMIHRSSAWDGHERLLDKLSNRNLNFYKLTQNNMVQLVVALVWLLWSPHLCWSHWKRTRENRWGMEPSCTTDEWPSRALHLFAKFWKIFLFVYSDFVIACIIFNCELRLTPLIIFFSNMGNKM